jgi:DNA-binding transcriptional MerR regulator
MPADETLDLPDALPQAQLEGRLRYRSGAVARMLRMPVATLRIWERRYQVTEAHRTPAGHRLYAAEDVKRLALLKQLTGIGHAISHIAKLSLTQLQDVAQGHARLLERAPEAAAARAVASVASAQAGPVPPRRYDDAALAVFAQLSGNIACECPAQVVTLLGQLTQFEDYSAQCQQLNPADAALHADLQRVAGMARALFEQALEQIAIYEGLLPPTGPAVPGAAGLT